MSSEHANTWPPATGEPTAFDPGNVNLTAVVAQDLMRDVICYLNAGENEYNGQLGARISALFVVLIVSSAVTFFPVVATRSRRIKIPLYFYLFARYFGAGVIIATAFIHLLNPAYEEIGPASCVGMTGAWAEYSWVPALALTSAMFVFLLDFGAGRYVEKKYGISHGTTPSDMERIPSRPGSLDAATLRYDLGRPHPMPPPSRPDPKSIEEGHSDSSSNSSGSNSSDSNNNDNNNNKDLELIALLEKRHDDLANRSFQQQIAAFLILEFGILFHSVIIGLTLGSAGAEFLVLYPVIVFHQAFEGLGIGARLSAIPFPRRLQWLPYALCAGYGLTTPVAIAVGLGLRTTYNSASVTANVVSGVLDAVSAGILLYTGFVELLARDFLFNPHRTNDDRQLAFMLASVLLGAALMSLLGKWA